MYYYPFHVALILSIQHSNINAIFPIWGPGKLEILKESTLSFSLFADFCILAALIPYMNSFKEFLIAQLLTLASHVRPII